MIVFATLDWKRNFRMEAVNPKMKGFVYGVHGGRYSFPAGRISQPRSFLFAGLCYSYTRSRPGNR